MQLKKNKNVVKYRKPMNFNIGVIIFVIIFIYLVFNVFSYLTETHISVYEVEQGTIAVNNVYNGLILRDEKNHQFRLFRCSELLCKRGFQSRLRRSGLLH